MQASALKIIGCSIVIIGGAFAALLWALQNQRLEWHFVSLYRYQLDKLQRTPKIDVLLVGDSTLGYAVDVQQWAKDLDKSVVSVALTGIYGFGGSLNMIKRGLRDHAISSVIIMHTPQLALRSPSHAGYLFTAPGLRDIADMPVSHLAQALYALVPEVLKLTTIEHVFTKAERLSENSQTDYLVQTEAASLKPEPKPNALVASGIGLDNLEYLRQIAATCRAHGIQCIYVHGTLTDSICRHSSQYFQRLTALIRESGLQALPEPTCMPWRDTGDAPDHLIPGKKPEYSRRYFDRVRPLLSP